MVRILSSISNQQPSSNMDDSGFFSIQVSMKRSFVGLMVVVVVGGGGLIFISFSRGGSRRGAWGPRLPPYFLVKLTPKGPKKFFGRPTPLISRSGSGTVQWFGRQFSNN